MIFITVGNAHPHFSRLVDLADDVCEVANEEVVVQHGHTPCHALRATARPFLTISEYEEQIENCSVVISHAGAGTIIASLAANKRLIVMPRRLQHSEHVNDHQIEIAQQLADAGYIECVQDKTTLLEAIASNPNQTKDSWANQRPPLLDVAQHWIDELEQQIGR